MSIEPPEPGQAIPSPVNYAVPWTTRETWLGVLLMAMLVGGMAILARYLPREGLARSVALMVLEPMLVLPVVIILGRKGINWKYLGFRNFPMGGIALGCGALLLVYPLLLLHNFILMKLGIVTQGQDIVNLYESLGTPIPLLIAGVLFAPLSEEIFFRGFLFTGLRQQYGWVRGMLISSAVFAAFHLQLVALVPTFVLGCVLAYAYQRSNSIWPGMILHFLINGLALCATAVAVQQGWA